MGMSLGKRLNSALTATSQQKAASQQLYNNEIAARNTPPDLQQFKDAYAKKKAADDAAKPFGTPFAPTPEELQAKMAPNKWTGRGLSRDEAYAQLEQQYNKTQNDLKLAQQNSKTPVGMDLKAQQAAADLATKLYGTEFTNKSDRTKKGYINAIMTFAEGTGIDPTDPTALNAMAQQKTGDGRTFAQVMGSPEVIDPIVENQENLDRARKKGNTTALWGGLAAVLGGPIVGLLGAAVGVPANILTGVEFATAAKGAGATGAPPIVQAAFGGLGAAAGASTVAAFNPPTVNSLGQPVPTGTPGGAPGVAPIAAGAGGIGGKIGDVAKDKLLGDDERAVLAAGLTAADKANVLRTARQTQAEMDRKFKIAQESYARQRVKLDEDTAESQRTTSETTAARGFYTTPYHKSLQEKIRKASARDLADINASEATAEANRNINKLNTQSKADMLLSYGGKMGEDYIKNAFNEWI